MLIIFSRVYYTPHPSERLRPEVDEYIAETSYIEKVDIPTYYLLASKRIKKVIGISSSVLFEAKYFGKEVEYLYRPLFKVDESFESGSYISVSDDKYWKIEFWHDVLRHVFPVFEIETNNNMQFFKHNKVRPILDRGWGFRQLDPLLRQEDRIIELESKMNDSQQRFMEYIAKLESKVAKLESRTTRYYPRFLALFMACFIPTKKNRHHFRKKHIRKRQ